MAHLFLFQRRTIRPLLFLFLIKVWLLSFSLSILCIWLKLKQENSKQSQANELFENCLQAYRGDDGNSSMIQNVLFDAAEEGNIDFDLLWKTKSRKSIFHVAADKRHESIFYLLNEIGSIGDLIIDKNGSRWKQHFAFSCRIGT